MKNFFLQQIKEDIIDEFDYPYFGHLYLNSNRQITTISHDLLKIVGFSSLNDFFNADAHKIFLRNNFNLISKIGINFHLNKVSTFEYQLIRNNGKTIDLNVHMIPNEKNEFKIVVEDISSRKDNEIKLEYHLLLEETLTKISNKLINDSNLNIEEITDCIKYVLKVSKVNFCIINNQSDNNYFSDIFDGLKQIYQNKEIDQINNNIVYSNDKIFDLSKFSWWFNTLSEGKSIVSSDISDLPEEANREKEYFKNINIISCCAFPILDKNKKLVGAINFNEKNTRVWTSEETRLIRLISEMIANYIERKISEEKIRHQLIIEKQINQVARMFAMGENTDINQVIKLSSEILKSDSCSIYTYKDNKKFELEYSYLNKDVSKINDLEQLLKKNYFINTNKDKVSKLSENVTEEIVENKNSLIVSNFNKLFKDSQLEPELDFIKSLITYPILSPENKILGNIEFIFVESYLNWNGKYSEILKFISEMLANFLQQKKAREEFELAQEALKDKRYLINKLQEDLAEQKIIYPKDSNNEVEQYSMKILNLKEDLKKEKSLRKEIQLEIEKTEEKFYLIINSIPDLVAYVDREQKYHFTNKKYRERFNLSEDEIIGKAIKEVKQKNFYLKIQSYILQALSGREINIEIEFKYEDLNQSNTDYQKNKKDLITLKTKFIPDIAINNRVKGVFIIIEDVTEIKSINKELIKNNNEFKKSNQELEQFAHIVSHDLKAPLSSISSYLQILQKWHKEELSEEANNYIYIALNSVDRINAMLKSLLNYSKEGKIKEQREEISFYKIVDAALKMLIGSITETKAKVTYGSLPTNLCVNKGQMIRLFQNLISNAIKYSTMDTPIIHIAAKKANKEWIISVEDNGIGIDSSNFEYIFEIFHRLHTQDDYEGEGIGLAICKKIIESHKGRIWVESELGIGSTFYFSLPA